MALSEDAQGVSGTRPFLEVEKRRACDLQGALKAFQLAFGSSCVQGTRKAMAFVTKKDSGVKTVVKARRS